MVLAMLYLLCTTLVWGVAVIGMTHSRKCIGTCYHSFYNNYLGAPYKIKKKAKA